MSSRAVTSSTRSGNEIATNQGFKSVVPAKEIDSSYLYFWLKSAKHLAEQQASGTTFKEISGSRFAKLPVPVAPLPEQRRIVEKIETLFAELDKGEESLRQVQTLLTRYRQSVLKAAVTESGGSRKRVQLGELLQDIRYGTAKKCRAEVEGVRFAFVPPRAEDASDRKLIGRPPVHPAAECQVFGLVVPA